MEVNEYVSEDGKPHLDVVMTATAGIKGKDERILDWEPITRTNGPFGLVESESISTSSMPNEPNTSGEITSDDFLALGRSRIYTDGVDMASEGSTEDRAFLDGKLLSSGTSPGPGWLAEAQNLQTIMVSKANSWVAESTWGFEQVGDLRRHTRRTIVTRTDGKEARRARLVYDFVGQMAT